jgi:hypothetical protein
MAMADARQPSAIRFVRERWVMTQRTYAPALINRSSQVDNPHFQPRPVRGVGSKALGDAGANWRPWLNQLLSARGKRVLIVNVNAESLPRVQRLEAAKAISLAVYDRL